MGSEHDSDPSARAERIRRERRKVWKLAGCGAVLVAVLGSACVLAPDLAPVFGIAAAAGLYLLLRMARRAWRRASIRARDSTPSIRAALERTVAFYGALEGDAARRFREEIEIFLAEKRILGVGTAVDEATRVLVAASAVIPVFGLPGWEWDDIHEVLLYPSAFAPGWRGERRGPAHTVGIVGDQELRRTMILTKPYLELAFARSRDGQHSGIHEFAHLIDWADGTIDGVPSVLLRRTEALAWVEVIRKEMLRIRAHHSLLDRYALESPAEFFAVASECFFERPAELREQHRELYDLLTAIYRQSADVLTLSKLRSELARHRTSRNDPCPCGSGKKLKRCCGADVGRATA
jgi:MtfA peptidase